MQTIDDIILDRVKDKLYRTLQQSLKGWPVDYVDDLVEAIVEDNKAAVYRLIKDKTQNKRLVDLEGPVQEIAKAIMALDLPKAPRSNQTSANQSVQKTPAPYDAVFPFTVRSLLQACWGKTLNFSHDTQQQALGALFNTQIDDQFSQIFMPRLLANASDPNSLFLLNLQMTISSSLRNLGLVRETHTEYLSCNADRLNKRRQTMDQIADLASFSGSGLYSKLGSFFGVGSAADIVTSLTKIGISLTDIPIFIVFGLIGAFALTIGVHYYVLWKDDTWDWKMRRDQNRYWREHYKKDTTNELYNLYLSIKELIRKFYPDRADDIMKEDELLRLNDEPELKRIIRDDILVTDELQWFPTLPPSSSQGSSAQGAGSDSSGQNSGNPQGQSKGKSSSGSKSS